MVVALCRSARGGFDAVRSHVSARMISTRAGRSRARPWSRVTSPSTSRRARSSSNDRRPVTEPRRPHRRWCSASIPESPGSPAITWRSSPRRWRTTRRTSSACNGTWPSRSTPETSSRVCLRSPSCLKSCAKASGRSPPRWSKATGPLPRVPTACWTSSRAKRRQRSMAWRSTSAPPASPPTWPISRQGSWSTTPPRSTGR